jgi:hypothetical protein
MGMRLSLAMVTPEELGRLSRDPSQVAPLLLHRQPEIHLAMEKEWHGIQFLLTGEPWPISNPLGMVIFGENDIGQDLGYGPARTLTVEQVKEVAAKLSEISTEILRGRYDVRAMTEEKIYPEVWEREGNAALDWLMAGYQRLVDFYMRASNRGYAVVLAIL